MMTIRALFDRQGDAMRAKDLDGLMAHYSPDVVYFDVVPPLRYVGSAALRARFAEWFAGYQGPIDLDARDVSITDSGDLAVVHWLSRAAGTLVNGMTVGSWVRATSCWQRTGPGWLVTHEHVSLPVDVARRSPATDLEP
jgi:ketosteroid isomerase-like protein